MSTFDIFVKGINPDRLEESEQIKKQLSEALKISLTDVDELLALPNGACIRRNTAEKEAIEYQRALTKLGLVALYMPTRKKVTLELEPIEDLAPASVVYPNCENVMPVEEASPAPEKCSSCGIDIAKFSAQKEAEAEREAIKAKLLATQSIQKALEEKRQQEEAQRLRKAELEKQVLEEIGIRVEEKKPINKKLVAAGVGSMVLALGGGYFFTASTPEPSTQTVTQSPVLAGANEANPSAQIALATPSANAPMDSQQAMQKTHDQAAQVLNGFGLDADAFAKAGENGAAPAAPIAGVDSPASVSAAMQNSIPTAQTTLPAVNSATPPNVATVAITVKMPSDSTSQNTTQQQNVAEKPILQTVPITQLLQVSLENDVTWDKFLAQNAKNLFEHKLPEKAVQLAQFIVAQDVFVDTLGEQIAIAQKEQQSHALESYLNLIEKRLTHLPLDEQAIYFTQTGAYLPLENGTNHLLAKAENLLPNLQTPELQLKAVLKLAVAYSKAGNIASANDYFNKINALLSAINDANAQAKLRAQVASSYCEINNPTLAMHWFNSLESLIPQLTPTTRSELANAYATCNQWQLIVPLLMQNHEETALYQALTVALKAGFFSSAIELHKALQTPIYQALADILIADYSPSIAGQLVETALQTAKTLPSFEKILVLAQAIDHFGKLKNKAETEKLLAQNKELLASLPASDEKDALLKVVALHYAHSLHSEHASFLLTGIQTSQLKTSLNLEISQLAKIRELLKGENP